MRELFRSGALVRAVEGQESFEFRAESTQLMAKVPHPKWVCLPMWSMDASSR